jgi:hypothetical protein
MFSLKPRETAQTQISELIIIQYRDYNKQNYNYKHGNRANLRGYGQ